MSNARDDPGPNRLRERATSPKTTREKGVCWANSYTFWVWQGRKGVEEWITRIGGLGIAWCAKEAG